MKSFKKRISALLSCVLACSAINSASAMKEENEGLEFLDYQGIEGLDLGNELEIEEKETSTGWVKPTVYTAAGVAALAILSGLAIRQVRSANKNKPLRRISINLDPNLDKGGNIPIPIPDPNDNNIPKERNLNLDPNEGNLNLNKDNLDPNEDNLNLNKDNLDPNEDNLNLNKGDNNPSEDEDDML